MTKTKAMCSDELECRLMCKNLKCLQNFLVTYTEVIRSYESSGKIRCPRCGEYFEFNPLEAIHIVKEE